MRVGSGPRTSRAGASVGAKEAQLDDTATSATAASTTREVARELASMRSQRDIGARKLAAPSNDATERIDDLTSPLRAASGARTHDGIGAPGTLPR